MTDIVRVSPTEPNPTHHISLSDGVTTIGLIALNPKGEPSYQAIRREPYPRNTLKVNQGQGQLSEMKPPYGEFTRETWINGIGQERGEADAGAYWFGKGMWTLADGKVTLAPKLFQSKLPGQIDCPWVVQGADIWYYMHPDNSKRHSTKFTTPASGQTIYGIYAKARLESGSTLTAYIVNDNAGSPDMSSIVFAFPTLSQVLDDDLYFQHTTALTLTGATDYWLVYEVGVGAARLATISATGYTMKYYSAADSAWHTADYPGYFVFQTERFRSVIPFEYRGALFKITNEAGSPHIYINGDQGACDSNAGALGTLVDATKSWGVLIGAVVTIIEGPGAGESRRVLSNTPTTLTVDHDWDTEQTTASSYVIKYTQTWTEITGHGLTAPVTSVVVTNENIVYMAMGASVTVRKFRAFNDSGTWKPFSHADCQDDDGSNVADLFTLDYDQGNKRVCVWRAVNAAKPYISQAQTIAWSASTALSFGTAIYFDESQITSITPYDGKIAMINKKGRIWMVQGGTPEPLSINMAAWYDDYSGRNAFVHSPYLIFPYSNGIEMLLGQTVKEFGPRLHNDYAGAIAHAISVEGAIIAGRSCKTKRTSTLSYGSRSQGSVQIYHGGVWHPCASMGVGNSVLSVFYQKTEAGKNLLWIFTVNGTYCMKMPRAWSPLDDPVFTTGDIFLAYENLGWMVIGSFDLGNRRLSKWWESIYVDWYTKATGNLCTCELWQVTPTHYEEFVKLPPFNPADGTKITLTSNSGDIRSESNELALVIVAYHNTASIYAVRNNTPLIRGINIEYLARIDDADMWSVPVRAKDYQTDLCGVKSTMSMQDMFAKLDEWARSPAPLTQRSLDPLDDNKRVILLRNPKQPEELKLSATVANGQEKYSNLTSVTILEVPD